MRAIRLLVLSIAILISGCSKHASSPTAPSGLPGTLTIKSQPGGMILFVDGDAGHNTPATVGNLGAGAHTLALSFTGYADTTVHCSVAAGSNDSVLVLMRPLSGTPRTSSVFAQLANSPEQVAVSSSGNVLVTSWSPDQLHVFTSTGIVVGTGGFSGLPQRLAAASTGAAYAAYSTDHYLGKYSSTGVFQLNLNYSGSTQSFPASPVPTIGPSDSLLVLSYPGYGSSSVSIYTFDSFSTVWSTPVALSLIGCASGAHRCFATGAMNDSVYVFTTGGLFQGQWPSGLNPITAIAVSSAGDVYLSGGALIRHFSPTGVLQGEWGAFGLGGSMAVDALGAIYALDMGHHQVIRFTP